MLETHPDWPAPVPKRLDKLTRWLLMHQSAYTAISLSPSFQPTLLSSQSLHASSPLFLGLPQMTAPRPAPPRTGPLCPILQCNVADLTRQRRAVGCSGCRGKQASFWAFRASTRCDRGTHSLPGCAAHCIVSRCIAWQRLEERKSAHLHRESTKTTAIGVAAVADSMAPD